MTRLLSSPLRLALGALGVLGLGALGVLALLPSSSEPGGGDRAGGSALGDRDAVEADRAAKREPGEPGRRGPEREPETEREREAREAAEGLYALLADASGDEDSTDLDGAALCDLMSEAARRRAIRHVRRTAEEEAEWECAAAISELLARAREAGGLRESEPAEVIAVNVKGERASVRIRSGGTVSRVSLVREDGEWRVGQSPANQS